MYKCSVTFRFVELPDELAGLIKNAPAPENFSYNFSGGEPADRGALVVFFGNSASDKIGSFTRGNSPLTLFISVCERDNFRLVKDLVDEVWELPLDEAEFLYRFSQLQKQLKLLLDKWQSENFLNSAINTSPSLVWFKSRAGIHEKVNRSFCETVGKTKQQVEGQRHAYIWDVEDDDPACVESDNRVMDTRELLVSEERISAGSSQKLLTTYKAPLYDFDGSVMGTVGVGVDITREREFEEELIRRNRTFEKVLTSIDCGVLCHSLDGSRIISVNDAALRILGYNSAEEMLKKGFYVVADSVLDEDKPILREKIAMLKNEGDVIDVEYRVKHDDGQILHIVGNVKLLCENGELFYRRFLLDCTAQKQRERETEQRNMSLLKALTTDFSLVCSFDLETGKGNTLRINECDNYEYFKSVFAGEIVFEECMNRYIEDNVYADDREYMSGLCKRERMINELAQKDILYINYRRQKKDEIVYCQMKIVREENNIVLGLRNVDEETRKEFEKENLLEEALFQANRANRAKSVFLSNMSHDIRTPMNAIVGFTTLALSHLDRKDQVEECLNKIMTSENHLLGLINDVLDMSRIESGKMHLEEKSCSLSEIIRGLRNILYADITSKQLELSVDTVDVVDEDIICDKLRLNQVLLNLLSNAVKYTPAGGKIIFRITQKHEAPEGCAAFEFLIKDNGIGMSEEFVTHIFEPFERERNTTISGIQGTGLGMAITKNIVDMMDGEITVKSRQGEGTECTVSMYFRKSDEHTEAQNLTEFHNCRALVVDDDFNTCDSVTFMLSQLGMRAEWTLSGKEAVLRTKQAMMREDNYSVYIVDCFLPDINGIEVVRRIRRATHANVPIIVLTAYDWSEFEDEAREAGVSAFCSKPLFMSELKNCLSSLVHNGQAENADNKTAPERSGRILLAEDNELNQEIAEALLTEAGFEVEIAENGKIAVEKVENAEPGYYKVVLMDVQMPVMNGYDATRAIRLLDDKSRAEIPILAMTANAFVEDKEEALKCGMNGHIAKPIDIKALLETLDKIIAGCR